MNKYKFYIYGLDCPNCSAKLERALNKSNILENVNLSFVANTLTLESQFNDNDVKEEINKIINDVEPEAYIKDVEHHHHEEKCFCEHHGHHHEHHHKHHHDDECCCGHQHSEHHHKNSDIKKEYIFISLSVLLLIVGLITEKLLNNQFIYIPIYLLGYVFISYDILYKSIKNIKKGQIFDENFLMSIASIGAICLQEFSEAILVIFLYKVGELFQDYAVNNSRKSIKRLIELQPKFANILIDNDIKKVDPSMVKVGDVIIVMPGEQIPLDGIIIEGYSSFDTSMISGESKPVDLTINNEVSSGYLNISSLIKLQVTKTFENSNVNKMLKLIEESMEKKSNNEKFITKFAKYYTPIVVLLAVLLVAIPSLIHILNPNLVTTEFSTWLYRGLVFLVISCPCALVISVPLSFFSGIGRCSKSGILVKGSNYLEKLSNVDTIVFDKTGTITKGNFVIKEIISKGISEDELLEVAYYCDYYSTHPIALAIKEKSKHLNIDLSKIEESINLVGLGVKSIIDSKLVLVGNEKLMNEFNIEFNKVNSSGTVIYVAKDSYYLGALIIEDEIKDDTIDSIKNIHSKKIKTLLLSGDNYEVCKDVCSIVGINNYKFNLSPLDKVEELKKVLHNKKKNSNVVFIGDGVNDAPSLVNADIGISMGGLGSDVAIESSDVVINDDSISKVIDLIDISKKTTRIVKQNIIFSIGIKVLIMILAILGLSNMLMGIFADVGVMILAVLNSLRILFKKI